MLATKHQKEIDDLKNKYESIINELKMNASNDKEFV